MDPPDNYTRQHMTVKPKLLYFILSSNLVYRPREHATSVVRRPRLRFMIEHQEHAERLLLAQNLSTKYPEGVSKSS